MGRLWNDQELIEQIAHGDQSALEAVYKSHRPGILNYIIRHGGTLQDAQDIHQDVMLAFHANVVSGRLTHLSGKLSTYVYRLTANQWHSQLRVRPLWLNSEAVNEWAEGPVSNEVAEDAWLNQLLDQLDERCQRILKLYYFEHLSMREVAHLVSLPDGESARKRKCDCLGKLRKLAETHPELKFEFE